MQFISNKINVGKSRSFEDICKDYITKKESTVKTASTKIAEADEAEGSGQLEVEPLHQSGESTDQDSVAGGKGDSKATSSKNTKDESKDEAEGSGQPEAEGKKEMNNDPYSDPKAEASSGKKVKEARKDYDEEQGEVPGEQDTGPNEYAPVGGEDDDDKDDDKDDKKDDKKDDDKLTKEQKEELPEKLKEEIKDKKSSSSNRKFKKIANLTSQERTRLNSYMKKIWPDGFVDALLAEK